MSTKAKNLIFWWATQNLFQVVQSVYWKVFFFVSNDLYVLLLKQTLKQNKKQKQKVTNRVTKQRLAHDSIWGWICHG